MKHRSSQEIERLAKAAAKITIEDAKAQAVQWNKIVYRQVIQEIANDIWQRQKANHG